MSTITSPRHSLADQSRSSSPSSIDPSSRSSSRQPSSNTLHPRRNRAALRDYYNLKTAPADARASTQQQEHDEIAEVDELDQEGFDAEKYVQEILDHEGLQAVLRAENGLVGDIRGLDGERKALVYDNYSKLIAATETIRRMKTNMDPLAPITSTLAPAISYIAETSAELSAKMQDRVPVRQDVSLVSDEDNSALARQRQTVRWVLGTPQRLRTHLSRGTFKDAEADYREVSRLLDRWDGVQGVETMKTECQSILEKGKQGEE